MSVSRAAFAAALAVASCSTSDPLVQGAPVSAVDAAAPLPDAGPLPDSAVPALDGGPLTLVHAGVSYSYLVHLPPSYDGLSPVPLVLAFHPFSLNGAAFERVTGFDAAADARGVAVVYPTSPDGAWDAGSCCSHVERDDARFGDALARHLLGVGRFDPTRVYAMGMSNGGFLAYRLGCESAETFAAIASVSGKLGVPDCAPSRPVPLLDIHGTEDPLIPYDASYSSEGVDVPTMVGLWAARDRCAASPAVTYSHGAVTCETWSGCDEGAEVTACAAVGGGHCWPGVAECPDILGAAITDLDANTAILDFLLRFELRQGRPEKAATRAEPGLSWYR